ncbi:MAG TPA: acid phosphatase, partial [Desulfovibrio sp.]|nr:acid phosphatase [Desulfovibrio sp.]
MIKAQDVMLSLPEVRELIVAYHEGGQYDKDVAGKAAQVTGAVKKALREQVPYPAVVVVVEDVLLS